MLERLEMTGHSMISQMAQMEVVTNNLANIDTTGYKQDKLFVNEMERRMEALHYPHAGKNTSVPHSSQVVDFTQGGLTGTERPLDVAITGNGLFSFETPQGEAYSRDGRFTISNDGFLVNSDGYPVLGLGGPIQFDLQGSNSAEILINDQGEVILDSNVIDKLKIVAVDDPLEFVKIGGNLFRTAAGRTPRESEFASVKQKFLEESNVDPIREMVTMMEIFHFYQSSQKMIHAEDNILNKAVNDIGRVQ
jgi:flagellar basal-body rod protein FlgG